MLTDHILFIDGEAMVIDKPAGLPVDPPRDGGLSLENHLSTLTFGFKRWPVMVHRLDRDTSGCLLLARHAKAAGRFTRAFEDRAVTKYYLAVVDGVPTDPSGTISAAIAKVSTAETGWRMVIAPPGAPGAKAAVSHWEVAAVKDGRALIRFRPETGRTHQLRVHAADALGHAIVGDPVYAPGASGARPGQPRGHGLGRPGARTMLHAEALLVQRGADKPPIAAFAPFPAAFAALGFAAPPCPAAVADHLVPLGPLAGPVGG